MMLEYLRLSSCTKFKLYIFESLQCQLQNTSNIKFISSTAIHDHTIQQNIKQLYSTTLNIRLTVFCGYIDMIFQTLGWCLQHVQHMN